MVQLLVVLWLNELPLLRPETLLLKLESFVGNLGMLLDDLASWSMPLLQRHRIEGSLG